MNVSQIKDYIGSGQYKQAESAWMDALSDDLDPAAVGETLGAFVEAEQTDTAEMLGWALLDAHADAPPEQTLAVARAALLAVPESQELRNQLAGLIRQVWADRPRFEEVYRLAGLEAGQRPERALRTLETCLGLHEALDAAEGRSVYMVNRYDGRVVEVQGYNDITEVFEFLDDEQAEQLEPPRLADEFELLPQDDFRVRRHTDPEGLAAWVHKHPADALVALCRARGGQITSEQLKETLDGELLPAGKWSGWWSRARAAAKKHHHLSIEGRNPVVIEYHPGGRTLEEDLQDTVAEAYEPLEKLEVLRTYLREADARKVPPQESFLQQIASDLAGQVNRWAKTRPVEALSASLACEEALRLGAPPPTEHPAPAELLAAAGKPAELAATLHDEALWNAAMDALSSLETAAEQLVALLEIADAEQLPRVIEELQKVDRLDALQEAVDRAIANPLDNVELLLWVWRNDGAVLAQPPEDVAVLSKLLGVLLDVDATVTLDREVRKRIRQRIRNALGSGNFKRFKQVLADIDEEMASVLKGYIERTDGLAVAAQEQMLQVLREHHPILFVKAKAQPWEDEGIIWTTESALSAHEEELRVLVEETMPANAKQIGEAAEEGDLRENADWQAAIEERDMLVARQRKMQADLARARTFNAHDVPEDHVGVGSKVTLKNLSTGGEKALRFLGPWDSDPENRIYAYTTRLAQQLMGQNLGATVTLDLGEGEALYEIVRLEPGL